MNDTKINALYEKYGYLIYGRCIRILGSEDDARDAMQEVFIKLINNMDKFKHKERIIPWIYTVSKNHCFNLLRQKKRNIIIDSFDKFADEENSEKGFSNRNLIMKILSFHNSKVQEAVYYTYIEELNQEEIRQLTGQSPATIRRNLKKFKQSVPHIRKKLACE